MLWHGWEGGRDGWREGEPETARLAVLGISAPLARAHSSCVTVCHLAVQASAISIIDVSACDEPACRPRPGRHRVWKRGEARETAVWGGGWVVARASSGPRARHHYTRLVHTEK